MNSALTFEPLSRTNPGAHELLSILSGNTPEDVSRALVQALGLSADASCVVFSSDWPQGIRQVTRNPNTGGRAQLAQAALVALREGHEYPRRSAAV